MERMEETDRQRPVLGRKDLLCGGVVTPHDNDVLCGRGGELVEEKVLCWESDLLPHFCRMLSS